MSVTGSTSFATGGGMRRRGAALVCAALALGLTSLRTQAQPREDRRGHPGEDRRHRPGDDRRQRPSEGRRPYPDHRPPARPAHQRPMPPPPPRGPMHGTGPGRRWHRGDRVPPMYRSRHYVVNDWRAHRLSRPPRGYHWVQYGPDYLLVAIATGVIVQLILSQ